MKRISVAIVFGLTMLACKKDNLKKDYGCVYGVSKSTGQRTYIRCGNHEIFMAGDNQVAADRIATEKNIPKENVIVMQAFTSWEFTPNSKCDCN